MQAISPVFALIGCTLRCGVSMLISGLFSHWLPPISIDEVKKEWLTEVLKKNKLIRNASVKDFSAKCISEGKGFTGQVYKVDLLYTDNEENAPSSLVIKQLKVTFTGRLIISLLNFHKEPLFYTRMATLDDFPIRTPKVYHYTQVLKSNVFMVMEDLSSFQQIGNWKQAAEVDTVKVETAINTLALLHSKCSHYNFDWLAVSSIGGLLELTMKRNIKLLIDNLGEYIPESIKSQPFVVSDLIIKLKPLLRSKLPAAMTHGDFRLDNMLWKESKELYIVDWQGIGVGVPLNDIAHFFVMDLPVETRRTNEKKWIESYTLTCKANGFDISFETAWLQYRLALVGCQLFALCVGGAVFIERKDASQFAKERFQSWVSRLMTAINDHNAIALATEFVNQQ